MTRPVLLVLMTDFGLQGPYLGQIRAVLARSAPEAPIIDLFSDLPACNPRASSVLIARYSEHIEPPAVFLCVVDPGVGGTRRPLIVKSCGRWFVGPENGLLDGVAAMDPSVEFWEIRVWRSEELSDSFHGRDLFAPVAAYLASGGRPEAVAQRVSDVKVRDDPEINEVIYLDHFGNAMTGIQGDAVDKRDRLVIDKEVRLELPYARTFCEAEADSPFWYVNGNGLVEIAVGCARAADRLGLEVGDRVGWLSQLDD